jgi:hypothetical protein
MVEIGDIIKLRPSVFAEEFHKYGDATYGYPWSEKYLYEDRFEYVSLRFRLLGQPGDMAKTFFGSSETIVEDIEYDYDGQPLVLLTSSFRIICPNALEKDEVTICSFGKEAPEVYQSEKDLIENLEFFEQQYLEGTFSVMERENNKFDHYRLGLYMMLREGKWKNI